MTRRFPFFLAFALVTLARAQTLDWPKVHEEGLRHLQALVQIDSCGAHGTKVAEYVKQVLAVEGIPARLVGKDPDRLNLIARLKVYGVPTMPFMPTGATDMLHLRAKGVQCYGVGVMKDEEDNLLGYGPHGDQERLLEEAAVKHLDFLWQAVTAIAGKRP